MKWRSQFAFSSAQSRTNLCKNNVFPMPATLLVSTVLMVVLVLWFWDVIACQMSLSLHNSVSVCLTPCLFWPLSLPLWCRAQCRSHSQLLSFLDLIFLHWLKLSFSLNVIAGSQKWVLRKKTVSNNTFICDMYFHTIIWEMPFYLFPPPQTVIECLIYHRTKVKCVFTNNKQIQTFKVGSSLV